MNDPNSQKRERVRELRSMADHARYQALRTAIVGTTPNMQAYADELEDEAESLERAIGPAYPVYGRRRHS